MFFQLPKKQTTKSSKSGSQMKLKKGQTVDDLIQQARDMVETKLSHYKDVSKCVLDKDILIQFFNEVPDDAVIGIDTETTGLNVLTDKLVGISLCNGKQSIYIPINHISPVFKTKVPGQIEPSVIKEIFGNVFKMKHYKWVKIR